LAQKILSADELNGNWAGTLTQHKSSSSVSPTYYFEIAITTHADGTITGHSFIKYEHYYGSFDFRGFYRAGVLHLEEHTLTQRTTVQFFDWCYKLMVLESSIEKHIYTLKGSWQGTSISSTCAPGQIVLHKMQNA
jgi:hypothetical protein